jgi:hypothetical protein
VSLHELLSEAVPDVTERETELVREKLGQRPGVRSAPAVMRAEIRDGNGPALVAEIRGEIHQAPVGDVPEADRRMASVPFRDLCGWCSRPGCDWDHCPDRLAANGPAHGSTPDAVNASAADHRNVAPVVGPRCRNGGCKRATPVDPDTGYHPGCEDLAAIKAARRDPQKEALRITAQDRAARLAAEPADPERALAGRSPYPDDSRDELPEDYGDGEHVA